MLTWQELLEVLCWLKPYCHIGNRFTFADPGLGILRPNTQPIKARLAGKEVPLILAIYHAVTGVLPKPWPLSTRDQDRIRQEIKNLLSESFLITLQVSAENIPGHPQYSQRLREQLLVATGTHEL